MAQYTQHYGLHQWEPGDSFLRTEFNEDLAKIDGALGEKSGWTYGSYTGNGKQLDIRLGFRPQAVLLSGNTNSTLVFDGQPRNGLTITDDGFSLDHTAEHMVAVNYGGNSYYYMTMR